MNIFHSIKLQLQSNRKKRKAEKKIRAFHGFMTVEASFLIPFSILLFVFIIYTGIFLYNKCVSVQVCYLAALRGSQEKLMNDQEVKEEVYSNMTELLNDKLLMNYGYQSEASVSFQSIDISIQSRVTSAASDYHVLPIEEYLIRSEGSAKRMNPTTYIRIYQRLK